MRTDHHWREARVQGRSMWGGVVAKKVHLHHEDILIEFNTRGSAVAAELAVLLGLDPETATAAEMDTAEARFVCSVCPPESQGRWRPLTWRDCVVHGNTTHGPPSWTLLSPLAAADVRRREETGDYSHAQVWSCTLCNVYLLSLGYYKYVKEHIVLRHAIAQPINDEHLIHFKGAESPRRKPVFLAVGGRTPLTLPMQPLCAGRPTSCSTLPQACVTGARSGSASS
ncbi:hypothetical protein B0H14DRAFT_3867259 [Mycena olivaceomarginata]|nr:hypothetical protein B0H14DRAFT_3867259 [Mycena olivaceomarginata]